MEPLQEKIVPAQLERRVYERLRDRILAGRLGPGEQLVEARLARELGVSKTPVREALIRLQRDGFVEIEPYRGARVVEPSEHDMREIIELRIVLESYVARDLAERRPADVFDALEATIAEGRRALESDDGARALDSLTAFSDVMTEACGNSRLARALDELRSMLLLIGNTSLRAPGREQRSLEQHERILAALRAGDADEAERATVEHVRSIESDSLGSAGGAASRDGDRAYNDDQ